MKKMTAFVLLSAALVLQAGAESAPAGAMEGWYRFTPSNDVKKPSAAGLSDWNREPAGTHGRIRRQGDKLFYNGKEIKLWGSNVCYADCMPDKAKAEQRAAFYSKFGLNTLRHHKHLDGTGWAGMQSASSFVEFDPQKLDRFDYFNSQLKQAGIFILHSPTFGVKLGRGDLERVPWHEELGELKGKPRLETGYGMVYLASEIQDLQIEQTVKLLDHKNPYTRLRYADDPFLFCVELFNEDSVLFSGTNKRLQQSPTIRARTAARFTEWLKAKYKTEEAWRAAWGERAALGDPSAADPQLNSMAGLKDIKGPLEPESFAADSVVPWHNPWFADEALKPGNPLVFLKQRALDTMEFLIGLQDEFYERFIAAIRETGFDGEIVASNWQAGSLAGHLLNLYSDSRTGIVDRHNYYKGGGFRGMRPGQKFNNIPLTSMPGGGSYSVGLQQVDGAVFMLSEWTHEQPNEWYAEGPALMGAYGWGLQGWDVSYHFQIHGLAGFSDRLGVNTWDGGNPAILTTFPAVSRMVRRLDVAESPETFYLNVHRPSLLEGKLSFMGNTEQYNDQKLFSTDKTPPEALAAARIAVRFTERFEETPAFDMAGRLDGDTVVSSTGELRWTRGQEGVRDSGHAVIRAKGTKGFVGFAPGGVTFDLGDGFRITPEKGFAVILLTARNPDKTLLDDGEIIITATARVRNSGMELNPEGNVVLKKGTPPILMEPVRAKIELPFNGELDVLDQDGIAADQTREFSGAVELDGTKDQTPFYQIRK